MQDLYKLGYILKEIMLYFFHIFILHILRQLMPSAMLWAKNMATI